MNKKIPGWGIGLLVAVILVLLFEALDYYVLSGLAPTTFDFNEFFGNAIVHVIVVSIIGAFIGLIFQKLRSRNKGIIDIFLLLPYNHSYL